MVSTLARTTKEEPPSRWTAFSHYGWGVCPRTYALHSSLPC